MMAHNSKEQLTNALFKAISSGGVENINALIRQGADVNALDKTGLTPLHYAAVMGSPEKVDALLKAGALANTQDTAGQTPLDWAEESSYKNPEEIKLTLKLGGAKHAKDLDMRDTLHSAQVVPHTTFVPPHNYGHEKE